MIHAYLEFQFLTGEQNAERQAFVDRPTIDKVIEAAPDSQWQAIIALCRYGGLRCPSEVLALKFEDIDWASGRFRVTSPKTKRYGKGSRVVPLFPELAIFLRDTMETAPVGKVYVIWKYRGENFRTEFERIVERAGLESIGGQGCFITFVRADRRSLKTSFLPTLSASGWETHQVSPANTIFKRQRSISIRHNPLIKVVQIWQQRAKARWSLKRKKPRQLPRLFSNVLQ